MMNSINLKSCMGVLLAYVCAQYLQRPEKGRRCLGLKLQQMVSYHVDSGNGTLGSVTTPSALFLRKKYLFIYYVYNILFINYVYNILLCMHAGKKRAPELIPDGCVLNC